MTRLRNIVLSAAIAGTLSGCSSDEHKADGGDAGKGDVEGGKEPGASGGTADLPALPLDKAPPIVFVHGFAGSAQQYESQAIRFAANGYPRERIFALDHDGAGLDLAGYGNQLDALVDKALAQFGVEKLFLEDDGVARRQHLAMVVTLAYGDPLAAGAADQMPGLRCLQADAIAVEHLGEWFHLDCAVA